MKNINLWLIVIFFFQISFGQGNKTPQSKFISSHFKDVTKTNLPINSLLGRSMDAKPADLDGDGDLDIVIANEWNSNLILINDGKGIFTDESEVRLPLVKHDSEDIAIGDFDNDGDLDIIFVSEDDQTNEYYLNKGKGYFEDASSKFPISETTNAVLTHDINDDGHLDILMGNAPNNGGLDGQNTCLINDGKGGWINETDLRFPKSTKTTQDLELGDIDGDGDLDLIIGNEDDNELWLNDGKGFFTDVSDHLPIKTGECETREVDFGDIDGDGDLDIFLANVNFRQIKNSQNRIWINDGKGVFSDKTEELLPQEKMHTVDGDFCDLDNDGDLDIITANAFGNSYRVYLNEGGKFITQTELAVLPASVIGNGIDVEFADFNNDGTKDLYLCNFGRNDLLLFGKK